MAADLFAASYTKLDRAREFISEFEKEVEKYFSSKPLSIRVTPNSEGQLVEGAYKAFGLKPGAIVGDAVHNMRTALDLMASELAVMKRKSPKNVLFPFCKDKNALDDAIKDKNFKKCGDDAVALLKEIAPYCGGNDKLRALHDMDIEDKHTALVTSNTKANFRYDPSSVPSGEYFDVDADFAVIFPYGHPFENLPVLDTLKELLVVVESVIKQFTHMVELRNA